MKIVGVFKSSIDQPGMNWIFNIPDDQIACVARMAGDGNSYTIGPPMKRVSCKCTCGHNHTKDTFQSGEDDNEKA